MSRTNFTSETLRLEQPSSSSACPSSKDGDRTNNQHLQAAVLSASQGYQKKKVSSFQITSIRPTSRSSNDGADDSENDTEDTSDILDSSRVTIDIDQETPSFSEDISKSEELLLGTGPVIPTSSQYGITALVQQTGAGGMMTARLPQGVTVNVTEGGLALAKADGEPDDLDNWQKRFKIVKIDSTEPFKRGRWICLDFMDSPALSSSENKSEEVPNLVVSNVMLSDGDSNERQAPSFIQIPLSLSSAVQYPAGMTHPVPNQFAGQVQLPVASSQVPPGQVQGTVHYTPSGGQPMQIVVPGYSGPPASQASVHPTPPVPVSSQVSTSSQSNIASNVHSKSEVQQTSGVSATAGLSQGTVPVGIQSGLPPRSISSSHSQPSVPVSNQSEQSPQAQVLPVSQPTIAGGIINQGLQPQVIGIPPNSTGMQQPQQPPLSQSGLPQPTSSTQPISQSISPQQIPTIPTTIHQPQIPSSQHMGISQQAINSGQQQQPQQIQNSLPVGSSTQPTSVAAQQITSGPASSITSTIQAASYASLPGTGATPTPATTPAQPQVSLGTGQSDSLPPLQPTAGTGITTTSAQQHQSILEGIVIPSQGGEAGASGSTVPEEADSCFRGLARALSGVATPQQQSHEESPTTTTTTTAPAAPTAQPSFAPTPIIPSPPHQHQHTSRRPSAAVERPPSEFPVGGVPLVPAAEGRADPKAPSRYSLCVTVQFTTTSPSQLF